MSPSAAEVLKRSRQHRRPRFVFLSKLREPQPDIPDKPVDSRRHRSRPPITAASTRRRSQRRGRLASPAPFPDRSIIGFVLCRLRGLELFNGFLSPGLSKLGVGGDPAFAARNRFGRRAVGRRIWNLSK